MCGCVLDIENETTGETNERSERGINGTPRALNAAMNRRTRRYYTNGGAAYVRRQTYEMRVAAAAAETEVAGNCV